jgi:hypothetical protein
MSELSSEVAKQPTIETHRLIERLGKDKVRAIAALGLAAASFLGISGKPESGVGIGVEVPDFKTGGSVNVGVMASSTEGRYPLGFPRIPGKEYKDIEAWLVSIGGAKFTVYAATLGEEESPARTLLGVYPGFETRLGKK